MNSLEQKLYNEAVKIHKDILPCGRKKTFSECYTEEQGVTIFWYDTEDGSTHLVLSSKLKDDHND